MQIIRAHMHMKCYNITSAREPETCLHDYDERRGNRVMRHENVQKGASRYAGI